MQELKSFRDMARRLRYRQKVLERDMLKGMELAAQLVEDVAKTEMGAYQPQMGEFNAWSQLKPATQADRVRQGYKPNDPLERSGELRDSITHHVAPLYFVVGSPDPIMLYQERGTATIPPRPVLGTALYRTAETVVNGLGMVIAGSIAGKRMRFPRVK